MDYFNINFIFFVILLLVFFQFIPKSSFSFKLFLAFASLVFLSTWGWIALSVVIGVVLLNWFIFNLIIQNKIPKHFFILGVVINIIIFISLRLMANETAQMKYDSVLPSSLTVIGFAFFILQNISVYIDIKTKEITKKIGLLDYLIYTIYFPKLLVGPIERFNNFNSKLNFQNLNVQWWRSLFLIALGGFQHLVISARIMQFYQVMKESYPEGLPVTVYWSVAILGFFVTYCDFAAYINIGKGISLLFGVDLTDNFDQPYLSRNPFDYWKRWHISLSSWMKDYVFNPVLLKTKNIFWAIFITFILVGLWHGFEKEFLYWALGWVLLQSLYVLFKRIRIGDNFNYVIIKNVIAVLIMFNLTTLVGMLTYHKLIINSEKILYDIIIDNRAIFLFKDYYLLPIFILIMIIVETMAKKRNSNLFYINASVFLLFLDAAYMFSSSYLFYYMRL